MFCFSNILNIFFSFVTCPMHKNPHQNAGNGIKETLFFKIFLGTYPQIPLEVLAPLARVGQIPVCPPPKFLSPYAYARENGNGIKIRARQSLELWDLCTWTILGFSQGLGWEMGIGHLPPLSGPCFQVGKAVFCLHCLNICPKTCKCHVGSWTKMIAQNHNELLQCLCPKPFILS